jgi:hypothetical protein
MQSGEALRPSKCAHLLSPHKIRELVMDSDSDDAGYDTYSSATEDDEVEPHLLSRGSCSLLSSAGTDSAASVSEDEDVTVQNVAGQHPQPTQWTLPPYPQRCVVHTFTGDPTGKSSEAKHITRDLSPLCVLLLFFAEIITVLLVESNWYYQDYFDSSTDVKFSPKPDVTETKMFVFLALTLQMGHSPLGRLEQLHVPFYSKMMKQDRYLHTLRFVHFTDKKKEMDRTDDRLWKIRGLFATLKANFSKIYNPSKHLAVDEKSHCEIQRKGNFQTVHPKETQMFQHQNVQTMRLYWLHL